MVVNNIKKESFFFPSSSLRAIMLLCSAMLLIKTYSVTPVAIYFRLRLSG